MNNHPMVLFSLLVFTMALVYLGSKTVEWHYKANRLSAPKHSFLKGAFGDGAINYTHVIRRSEGETVSRYRIMSHWIMALMYAMVLLLIVLGLIYKSYTANDGL